MDEQEWDEWGEIIDAALDSPDASEIAVPRDVLIAVDLDLSMRTRPVDRATSAVMWFALGLLAGVVVVAGYATTVIPKG